MPALIKHLIVRCESEILYPEGNDGLLNDHFSPCIKTGVNEIRKIHLNIAQLYGFKPPSFTGESGIPRWGALCMTSPLPPYTGAIHRSR